MPATSTLHHAARIDQTRRRLGKLGHYDSRSDLDQPALRLVKAAAPARELRFPLGAQTRRVDASGRLKYNGGANPSRTVGWKPGALQATVIEGWLVLSQPAQLIGKAAVRYSSLASFTVAADGVERVQLKPAHLDLVGLPEDRNLLVAAVPDSGVLVVVDPVTCLLGAPVAVAAALSTIDDAPDNEDQRSIP